MAFRIRGFGGTEENKNTAPAQEPEKSAIAPRKSVVQVRFPGKGMALAYYNDQFDLKIGDLVYVDGKLEGELGRVVEINYNFKIKISEYKKVIALVDTNVSGQLFMAGSHFVTFDPNTLPKEQVSHWFKAPAKDDEEYVTGSDDTSFYLCNLKPPCFSDAIMDRGHDYYMENKVRYICLDGERGFAIVEGTKAYTVEFHYQHCEISGMISNLTCDCFCSYNCKHEFAALLQLRETLELIDKHYSEEYARTGYFAAINKGTLFSFAIDGKETGSFIL